MVKTRGEKGEDKYRSVIFNYFLHTFRGSIIYEQIHCHAASILYYDTLCALYRVLYSTNTLYSVLHTSTILIPTVYRMNGSCHR